MVFFLAAMTLFAGGGQQKAAPADPNTLTVWCWDVNFNLYAMHEAAKVYQKTHPNFKLNVVEVAWDDLQTRLITAFSANQVGDLPDMVLMQDNAMQKNIQTYPSRFLPVNGKVDISQFAKYKLDFATVGGKTYAVPFDNGASGFFLREDIIQQAGLKISDFDGVTWDKVFELGKQVKQRTGMSLLSTDPTSPDLPLMMLFSTGNSMFDAQGKPSLSNNAVMKRALELFAEGIRDGIIMQVSDWNAYIATIQTGTVAGTINGAWIIGSITSGQASSGKWKLVRTPSMSNVATAKNYSTNGGSGWMILANSRNPELAYDFLGKTFAGSVDLYNTILPSSGAIGTWGPATSAPAYSQAHPFFGGQKVFVDLVTYANNVPSFATGPFYYEARDAFARNLNDIVQGRISVQAALDAAQKEVDFILSSQ